jgi:23S rRNA U2552 (ribose-2'-O)-methylase RlmE/FtsJ
MSSSIEHTSHGNGNGAAAISACYYNYFSLPQIDMRIDEVTGNYIPLEISFDFNERPEAPYLSASMYSHLCDMKQQIEKYQEDWDNIKKFTNPYEYIHTNINGNKTNISKLRPLSRSFYKMIEIIVGSNMLDKYANTVTTMPDYNRGIRTFHLAEGPGGFIEAISYLRGLEYDKIQRSVTTVATAPSTMLDPSRIQILKRNTEFHDEFMKENEFMKVSRKIFDGVASTSGSGSGHPLTAATTMIPLYGNDRYYGMTLVNDDPICPGWKKTKSFLEANPNVIIETGEDKTGNLISLANFRNCSEKYKNKMDIITADGGFDFSVDFNNQENIAVPLILSEVFYALALQKEGGSFILKIFDIFHKTTVDILYLLSYYYTNVCIMKPYTSRIANSEKYVICQGFKVVDSALLINQICNIFHNITVTHAFSSILSREHDLYFLNKIEEMNAMLSFQQIENISSTLSIITTHKNTEKLEQYKKQNIQKCISWCEKYNIPYYNQNVITQSGNIFLHRP